MHASALAFHSVAWTRPDGLLGSAARSLAAASVGRSIEIATDAHKSHGILERTRAQSSPHIHNIIGPPDLRCRHRRRCRTWGTAHPLFQYKMLGAQ